MALRLLSFFYVQLGLNNHSREELSQYFEWTAYYHFMKALRRMHTHLLFGDHVRFFCYNGRKPPNRPLPDKTFEDRYGLETLQKWTQSGRIQAEKLYLLNTESNTICFGISLDFISRYWQAKKSGDPNAAITAGSFFTEGATKTAEVFQSIVTALAPGTTEAYIFSQIGLCGNSPPLLPLSEWPDGSYMIDMRHPHPPLGAHTIAIILEGKNCFIQDPYYGTLIFPREQAGSTLFQIQKEWSRDSDIETKLTGCCHFGPAP